jgi:membrane fusion protein
MSALLFREEVFTARATQMIGSIVLMRPIPIRLAAWLSSVLTVATIIFLVVGEYTPKVRVTGKLVPKAGLIKVIAPQFGRVVACHVHEGSVVEAGQVIYELSS